MKAGEMADADKGIYSLAERIDIGLFPPRPFKLQPFKEGEFIPLMLVGSIWWDSEFNLFRFCGESVIDPDLSSDIVKFIPHYYVIGVEATKQQDK